MRFRHDPRCIYSPGPQSTGLACSKCAAPWERRWVPGKPEPVEGRPTKDGVVAGGRVVMDWPRVLHPVMRRVLGRRSFARWCMWRSERESVAAPAESLGARAVRAAGYVVEADGPPFTTPL